ncbi:MAG: hypothetical protein OEW00_07545 [candidate division Zixibacteria bacterium]|nr:hypothetical protein [candidate division Zixibacteria bacterium]
MRRFYILFLALGLIFVLGHQDVMARSILDRDGNRFAAQWYQLFRDADGDGIPNCMDPDWYRPQDGAGYQERHQNGLSTEGIQAGGNGDQSQYRSQYRWNYQSPDGKGDRDRLRDRDRDRDGDCDGDRDRDRDRSQLRDRTCQD